MSKKLSNESQRNEVGTLSDLALVIQFTEIAHKNIRNLSNSAVLRDTYSRLLDEFQKSKTSLNINITVKKVTVMLQERRMAKQISEYFIINAILYRKLIFDFQTKFVLEEIRDELYREIQESQIKSESGESYEEAHKEMWDKISGFSNSDVQCVWDSLKEVKQSGKDWWRKPHITIDEWTEAIHSAIKVRELKL